MYPNHTGFLLIPDLEWKSFTYGLIKLLRLFLFKILRANLIAVKNTEIRRLKKIIKIFYLANYFIRS